MVLKTTCLNPGFQYYQKSVENRPSKLIQQNLTHFGQFLGTQCMYFALKPWIQADRFECHEPYIIIGRIFFLPLKGFYVL